MFAFMSYFSVSSLCILNVRPQYCILIVHCHRAFSVSILIVRPTCSFLVAFLLYVINELSHCASSLCFLTVRPHYAFSLCVLRVNSQCASSLCFVLVRPSSSFFLCVFIMLPPCASSCFLIVCPSFSFSMCVLKL